MTTKGRQQKHLFNDKRYAGHRGPSLVASVDYRDEHYRELAESGSGTALGLQLKRRTIKSTE